MAKLGERVSTGAWIYALGNGLRSEFKECKEGILYSKTGLNTVMEVKTKLLSEEAVLVSQTKKAGLTPKVSSNLKDDEIALTSLKLKDTKKSTTKAPTTKAVTFQAPPENITDTQPDPTDKVLWLKGKRGKNHSKGKGKPSNRSWYSDWTQSDSEYDRSQ